MHSGVGRNWILNFRRKLIWLYLLKSFFIALTLALAAVPFGIDLKMNVFFLPLIVFLIVCIGILLFKPSWKITPLEVANYLNANFQQLEESATLFLKPEQELSLLEKLQLEKIDRVFPIAGSLRKQLNDLGLSLLFVVMICLVNGYLLKHPSITQSSPTTPQRKPVKENILPEIAAFSVSISPPNYTRKASRVQQQFTLKVETGAQVRWNIKTTDAVKTLRLIFNDTEIVNVDANGKFSKIIRKPGFYQLELNGKKSDLYPIEVIPDLPVRIKISQPKPRTTIDIGQLPKVNLRVALADDYGIEDAYISATLSSGKGEGVSFTERKLTFNVDMRGKKAIQLSKLLDLTEMGMKPGDELYFFISAKDNNGQSSRSDVYLISIVDPAELMSMAGMTNGVDLIPEYFRSQRQIIIDTEKLIKEQVTLSTQEFNNRSNALGMDQKLLRLRYGKFLGEESETGVGGDHDHVDGDEHEEIAFGDVKALMDEYAHKHDIAEDATFFEPELKAQLKAVLNEMWSSELQLRINKPREALPFEYKALRLLKDLQQKSRAYVAKTTLKTAKLKLEKRLTGELDKVINPLAQHTVESNDRSDEELKMLLSVLEKTSFAYGDRELLRAGEKHLIVAAASQPSIYLPALKSLRKLSSITPVIRKDIGSIQRAIQRLLGVESIKPHAPVVGSEANLYRSYFNHLKNGN